MRIQAGTIWRAIFPARLTQWIGPLLAGALSAAAVAGLVAIATITSGVVDLSASTPHPEGWARLLHYSFERATDHQSHDAVVPADFGSAAQVAKGATYYGMVCAACHGGPGLGQSPVALSMRPQPQYLVREVPTLSDRQLFWVVKHGVKYSAMPAWPVQDRDDEVWAMVSFLRRLPTLSTAQFRTLAYGDSTAATGAVAPIADGVRLQSYATGTAPDMPGDSYAFARPAIGFDAFALRGDVVAGCARCHGDDGAGRPGGAIPNLTLLDATYFRQTLRQFAAGSRRSGFMQQVATQLSDAQIDALARHYAALPRHAAPVVGADPQLLALGARVATAGIAARRVDACANCHDISRAAAKVFPRIDGQNLAYLRGRMLQFRTARQQPGTPVNPMLAVAREMTGREIDAVALYYAARPATKSFRP